MANTIKWSGIEQWKYGLTARWYVSAYYGNDIFHTREYRFSIHPVGACIAGKVNRYISLLVYQDLNSIDACIFYHVFQWAGGRC